MPLVEVVSHPSTQSQYTDQATQFYKLMSKAPVVVKKETPEFVASLLISVTKLTAWSKGVSYQLKS